jgi:hypothetical protein
VPFAVLFAVLDLRSCFLRACLCLNSRRAFCIPNFRGFSNHTDGEEMNTLNATDARQEALPVTNKKVWAKPMLDILKLESAQTGTTGLTDGLHKHRSY